MAKGPSGPKWANYKIAKWPNEEGEVARVMARVAVTRQNIARKGDATRPFGTKKRAGWPGVALVNSLDPRLRTSSPSPLGLKRGGPNGQGAQRAQMAKWPNEEGEAGRVMARVAVTGQNIARKGDATRPFGTKKGAGGPGVALVNSLDPRLLAFSPLG